MGEQSESLPATPDGDEAIREEIRATLRQRNAEKPEHLRRRRALTDPEKAGITMTLATQSQYQ
jgi:hypothetical protein